MTLISCVCVFALNSGSFCLLENPALINNKWGNVGVSVVSVSVVWGFCFNWLCPFVLLWMLPYVGLFILILSYLPSLGPLLPLTPVVTSASLSSRWFVGVLCHEIVGHRSLAVPQENQMCVLGLSTIVSQSVGHSSKTETSAGPVSFGLTDEGKGGMGGWQESVFFNRASNWCSGAPKFENQCLKLTAQLLINATLSRRRQLGSWKISSVPYSGSVFGTCSSLYIHIL